MKNPLKNTEPLSYEIFRQRALQSLSLKGVRKQFPNMYKMSKDELERWVKREYKRHYGKKKKRKK